MNKPSCDNTQIAKVAMFKNKLQEYTQKQCLPLPAYRTANEGFQHAPKFRATVYVDGIECTSKSTFRRLREAEQDAAKLACECILSNAQQSGFKPAKPPMFENEKRSDKSILHELTFKKHGDIPKYETALGEGEGNLPVYVSKVTVNDKTFSGTGAKKKRDAEQLAARAALDSLLGTDSNDVLNQMMTPKRKYFAAPVKVNCPEFNQKKIKNSGVEVPGNASQVKRMLLTSAPHSSTPVTRPVGTSSAPRSSTPFTRPVGTSSAPHSSTPSTRPVGTSSAPRSSTPFTRPVGTSSAPRSLTPWTRPDRASTPHSSSPVTRPTLRRPPKTPGVRYGMGNVAQGSNLMNRKVQQHGHFS